MRFLNGSHQCFYHANLSSYFFLKEIYHTTWQVKGVEQELDGDEEAELAGAGQVE